MTTKNIWDKLDVVGKLISGIVLVVIALLVKIGADNIASSLQTGDLVQSLIADLTTKDERARQDIALIALNHSVGDQKGELVAEIAERLFWDLGGLESLGGVAFQILEQRNPERAEEIREELLSGASTPESREHLRSSADTSEQRVEPAPPPPPEETYIQAQVLSPQARLLARAFPNLIYIQFHGEGNRKLAEGLQVQLQKEGFYAPGVEQVDQSYPNGVRFFHVEDRKLAQKVVDIAESFLDEQGKSRKFQLKDFSRSEFAARVPRGQVEVWINLDRP